MVQKNNKDTSPEHSARASANNLPISTKHGIEISRFLRYKSVAEAKKLLEEVIALKRAVPFRRFKRDIGHKAGMAAGRFPKKAAGEFLGLMKAVEANAQFKGLDSSNLKIVKILANKASVPLTGGRHRRGTKRTSLEVEVKELAAKKEKKKQEKEKKEPEKKEKGQQAASQKPQEEAKSEVRKEEKAEEKIAEREVTMEKKVENKKEQPGTKRKETEPTGESEGTGKEIIMGTNEMRERQ